MSRPILLDTGPLVALLNPRDRYHAWAKQTLAQLRPPLLTCEAVLSETWFLLNRLGQGQSGLLTVLEQGRLLIGLNFETERDRIIRLMRRYDSVPMSLADGCLVRLSELYRTGVLLTLDSDFAIYRRFDRESIPRISPEE